MEKKHLLLLHGALGSAAQMEGIAEKLKNNYTVHCIDLAGHGKRCDGSTFTMQSMVSDVHQYIKQTINAPCNIFGYSMGGYVALQLALLHPSSVTRVMTLGTKLEWNEAVAEKETALLNPELMQEKVPQFVTALKTLHGDKWSDLVMHTANLMRHLALEPLTVDDLQHIKHFVRLAIADKDNMVTLEETKSAMQNLQHGSLLVIPESRHPFEKVDHDRIIYEINNFL